MSRISRDDGNIKKNYNSIVREAAAINHTHNLNDTKQEEIYVLFDIYEDIFR